MCRKNEIKQTLPSQMESKFTTEVTSSNKLQVYTWRDFHTQSLENGSYTEL